jgi:galactose oxidase-like protein
MTALPDGTYLILNGGQQGVAGFGLANTPNLNAVLYDPSKPVNKRMSVMANTTIARMYHSEAILMPDGRVLVSGSDPQSDQFPEEYRVEVFIPPYLMGNPTRPAFEFSSSDTNIMPDINWGQSFQITLTAIPSGNAANVKISLMGAESSTHGNTMGQRTIFPAFSCTSTSCTIQAPPNAHVSPPGWFQLFVLDNGVPSHSKFIRIGGDPGSLGNWPNFPDFTNPGI